ncbi:MAG: 30S ribosomal protein S4 [Candidatus Vogelbacteria bacterium]|nr:30S ribosomal protein S4 [Candidatus Vogelbacteria bacterium]
MIIGKKYKICRRLGDRVFNKCQTPAFSRSIAAKRIGGMKRRPPKARSEYAAQMLEKQKARFTYNVSEKQFSNYVEKSRETKGVNPADFLYKSLEGRLDNVVHRMGFAPSRAFARQMVSHGHITVNDKKVNIPSYQLKKGDKVSIRPGSKAKTLFNGLNDKLKNFPMPKWIRFDMENLSGEVIGEPSLLESASLFNLNSVIEFYSRT